MPEELEFRTKPQIALELIERAMANGIRVAAWTFDEFYGRNGEFLEELQAREQAFVAEVPVDFYGWVKEPRVLRSGRRKPGQGGRRAHYPRVARGRPPGQVRYLCRYSPVFRRQPWQPYRIKDTHRGPLVWEVKWSSFWWSRRHGLPGRRHCLIVARNVLTGEMKYFVSNRVPGEAGVTLSWLLWVGFGRWPVESCFREGKEELGLDHYEVRGWRCVHRHFFVTQLSHLFCARMRQEYDHPTDAQTERLTVEQIRSAMNTWLSAADLKAEARKTRYEAELQRQRYHQRRNRQARKSHTKTRIARLTALGIDLERIPSCIPQRP